MAQFTHTHYLSDAVLSACNLGVVFVDVVIARDPVMILVVMKVLVEVVTVVRFLPAKTQHIPVPGGFRGMVVPG